MAAKDSWGGSECNHTGRADVAMSPCPKTLIDLGSLSHSVLHMSDLGKVISFIFPHHCTMRLMMAASYVKQFCCLLKEKYNEGSEILLLSVGKPHGGKMYGVLGWINLWMSKWSCL